MNVVKLNVCTNKNKKEDNKKYLLNSESFVMSTDAVFSIQAVKKISSQSNDNRQQKVFHQGLLYIE